MRGRSPVFLSALCAAMACAGGHDVAALAVSGMVATAPLAGEPADATMALYATIRNRGEAADTLVGIETAAARSTSIHATTRSGGMMAMTPVRHVVVPPDSAVRLAPGGTHVMLESLERPVVAGDTLAVVFVFRAVGRVAARAAVVRHEQLDSALHASPRDR